MTTYGSPDLHQHPSRPEGEPWPLPTLSTGSDPASHPPRPSEPPNVDADADADEASSGQGTAAPGDAPPPGSAAAEALVRAAVTGRPLAEVAQLVELLNESPDYVRSMVQALRTVGTDRSVEDVTELASLLTRHPGRPDSADEAIRTAAAHQSVDDVSRLLALLRQPPLDAHCAQEAMRTAATSRPVEDVVVLIDRLHDVDDRAAGLGEETADGQERHAARPHGTEDVTRFPEASDASETRGQAPRPVRPAAPHAGVAAPMWARVAAVVTLLLCAAAYFPLHRGGASTEVYTVALAVSALCVLLALTLALRSTPAVLAVGLVLPVGLTAAQMLRDSVNTPVLTRALEITAAPQRIAGLAAVAALATMVLLLVLLVAGRPARRPAAAPDPAAARD